MSSPLLALLAFTAWTLGLVLVVISYRTALVLMGRKTATDFPSGQEHGPGWYWRCNRAHANALENLLPFAVIVLVGHAVGHTGELFGQLAWAVVGLRGMQTLAHLIADTPWSVTFRATFYFLQLIAFVGMGVLLLGEFIA